MTTTIDRARALRPAASPPIRLSEPAVVDPCFKHTLDSVVLFRLTGRYQWACQCGARGVERGPYAALDAHDLHGRANIRTEAAS